MSQQLEGLRTPKEVFQFYREQSLKIKLGLLWILLTEEIRSRGNILSPQAVQRIEKRVKKLNGV